MKSMDIRQSSEGLWYIKFGSKGNYFAETVVTELDTSEAMLIINKYIITGEIPKNVIRYRDAEKAVAMYKEDYNE